MTCSYAMCDRRPIKKIDEWLFCRDHAITHQDEAVGASSPAAQPEKPPKPIRCGTIPGYQRHLTEHELPCRDCKKAQANSIRQKRKRARANSTKAVVAACGTRSGYQRHYNNNEKPCDACTDVERKYQRERDRRKQIAA